MTNLPMNLFVKGTSREKKFQKQPSRGVLRNRCSENMQQIYRRKLQSNFIEITLRHGCSLVNLLHIFRTPVSKNTSGGLLLKFVELDLESVNARRWSRGLCYMFKIMKNQPPEYLNNLIPKRRQNFNSRISII